MALEFGETAVLEPIGEHRGTCIFVHGLGFNTGPVWAQRFKELRTKVEASDDSSVNKSFQTYLRHTKFVFPTAPLREMTLMNGEKAHGWYNVRGVGSRNDEPCPGIDYSAKHLHDLVQQETDILRSKRNEASSKNVVLSGFSQGGTMTTVAGHTCPHVLGALIALSGYVCAMETYFTKDNIQPQQFDTPYIIVQGDKDDVVLPQYGETTMTVLSKLREGRLAPKYWDIKGLAHDVTDEELEYVFVYYGVPTLLPPTA